MGARGRCAFVGIATALVAGACTAFDGATPPSSDAADGGEADVATSPVPVADAGRCSAPDAGRVLFGAQDLLPPGGQEDYVFPTVRDAYGYAVTATGKGRCAWVYMADQAPKGGAVVGVYTEREGAIANGKTGPMPNDLVASGARSVLEKGWNAFPLDRDVAVEPGGYVWIAIGNDNGSLRVRNQGGKECLRGQRTMNVLSELGLRMPSPWINNDDDNGQCLLLAYVTE